MIRIFAFSISLLLPVSGFAVTPAKMGLFQRGPLGYGQAFLDRSALDSEGSISMLQKSGREDSPFTDLTGETQTVDISAGGYIKMNETFYLLFGAEAQDTEKSYTTQNKNYEFSSHALSYNVETGAHFDKGAVRYGSKIAVRMFGEENRKIRDALLEEELRFPEAQVPYLKFWYALIGKNSKLGLTLNTHNKEKVRPKSSSTTTAGNRYYSRSIPGELWVDLSMRHTDNMVLAFGLHLKKLGQSSESVQDTSNIVIGDDRYRQLTKDQYELLVGNEYTVTPFMKIYSSLVYAFEAFDKKQYASIIQDNIGGTQFHSNLSLTGENQELLFGLSYYLAKQVDSNVGLSSAAKPWAGNGNQVKVSQAGWAFLFSWRSML